MASEDKERKILGLRPNVFSAGVVSLLMDISSEMIYPLVPLFLSSALGVNKSLIGVIEGVAEATAGVLKTYSGWLSDKLGKRKILMVAGYGISTLSRPFMALSSSWVHVLTARLIDRTGKGIRGAPRDALIADSTPISELGASFGFHRAMDTIGAAIGPVVAAGLLLAFSGNYRLVFWASMLPGALAVLAIILFIRETDGRKNPHCDPPKFTVKSLDSRFIGFLIVAGLFSLGNSSDAFLILKAGETGISNALIPIVYLCFNLTYALISIPAGVIADRIGREKVIIAGLVLFCLVYFGFGLSTKSTHIWILFICYGIFLGMTEGVQRAYIGSLIAPRFRGTAFGLHNTVVGLMALPASIIGGLLWDRIGPHATFYYGSIMSLSAAVLFVILMITMPKSEKQ